MFKNVDPLRGMVDIEHFNEDTQHVVLWSGGCDSTLLLWTLLRKAERQNMKRKIMAITASPSFLVPDKLAAEIRARERITDEINARGYMFDEFNIKIDTIGKAAVGSYNQGLPQQLMWVSMALPYVPDNSIIHFGYIRGDDFWMYRQYVESIVENMGKMLGKKLYISYPLSHTKKYEVISELKKDKLYKRTWFCERPTMVDGKPIACGYCDACKTHKMHKLYLKNINDEDAKNRLSAKQNTFVTE